FRLPFLFFQLRVWDTHFIKRLFYLQISNVCAINILTNMVKLTPELIQQSGQYINAIRDRELDLRGYKIPIIENLGATLDQFDTIDLSDNDIRKVDGFPLLRRLKSLLLNNNRIVRVAEDLQETLPSLESLILTNNLIQDLNDLDPLVTVKSLRCLSLVKNPVINRRHYREYLIYKLPQLTLLDFKKIKMKERDEANKLFKSKKGKQLEKEIARKAKTFVPGAELEVERPKGLAASDILAIKDALTKVTSLDEIEHLDQMLKSGQIPGMEQQMAVGGVEGMEMEVMEMDQHVWMNGN
uniref:Probable U2 small nuclear ribonucleoprotein A' n=1 Tax=Strigamia maritima TaxID=126957 RepID=T1J0P1_STRMM